MDNSWYYWSILGMMIKDNLSLIILFNSLGVVFLYYTAKGGSFFVRWLGKYFFMVYYANNEALRLAGKIIGKYGYAGLAVLALIPAPFFREVALFVGVAAGLKYTLLTVILANALVIYLSILVIF